jgi:hypothetical protein
MARPITEESKDEEGGMAPNWGTSPTIEIRAEPRIWTDGTGWWMGGWMHGWMYREIEKI